MPGLHLTIRGIVQGVGFRPFVYRTAAGIGLDGWVANTGSGVELEVWGSPGQLERFRAALTAPPPLAVIQHMEISPFPDTNWEKTGFAIRESGAIGNDPGALPPDAAICSACLRELFDPTDRRYLYPFINCTDCGPRYTVIANIPYDRPYTTMRDFLLCPSCAAEYRDPLSRRFHAQTNCCPVCGPHYTLHDHQGRMLGEIGRDHDAIRHTAYLLAQGAIVAIKGIGGFHLGVDAGNDAAVALLRRRKHRPDKPLAVMTADLQAANRLARIDALAEQWLCSPQRPIVLVPKLDDCPLAPSVAPATPLVGLMLPYVPLHHLLLGAFPGPALVMTSGNMAGSPIIRDNAAAFEGLGRVADYFLIHDREILIATDDSVLRVAGGRTALVRRSRSFVPAGVALAVDAGRTLAFGPMLKNTICLTRGREAFLSHHIGDLENPETTLHQQYSVAHCLRSLRLEPDLIVHDLHPDYPSTRAAIRYAQSHGLPCLAVQHHHAHAVSCMAEHGLSGPVLALTLDGAGWGDDGTVWGGELLLAEMHGYRRLARLRPLAMPGGDRVIHEPWRMAVAMLHAAAGREGDFSLIPGIPPGGLPILLQMLEKGINCPRTSSCGRLFDGAAALLGLCPQASFEGQAAASVEFAADLREQGCYAAIALAAPGTGLPPMELDTAPLIRMMAKELMQGVPVPRIAARFHNTLVQLFADACQYWSEKTGIREVVCSGGVFYNLFLTAQLVSRLDKLGLRAYTQDKVPTGDGGLALGQAVAGRAIHTLRSNEDDFLSSYLSCDAF